MPSRRQLFPFVIAAIASVGVIGCGSGSSSSASPTAATGPAKNKLTKLVTEDVVPGKGPLTAKVGDTIWVYYVGKTADGNVFDSKELPDEPASFGLLDNALVKGWVQGIPGMKVGGERKISIPSDLGYGTAGNGKIPPNADLFFDIKLAYVVHPGQESEFDKTDTKVGTGPEVKKGSKVSILYTGALLNDKVVTKEIDPKKPVTFTVGKGEVLSGLDYGIIGMKKGGKRTLLLPPNDAFGATPTNENVPANSPMIFKVELLDVK